MIPEKNRRTLCVSSQAGCALQCTFCATGAQGFDQNLESHNSDYIEKYLYQIFHNHIFFCLSIFQMICLYPHNRILEISFKLTLTLM